MTEPTTDLTTASADWLRWKHDRLSIKGNRHARPGSPIQSAEWMAAMLEREAVRGELVRRGLYTRPQVENGGALYSKNEEPR